MRSSGHAANLARVVHAATILRRKFDGCVLERRVPTALRRLLLSIYFRASAGIFQFGCRRDALGTLAMVVSESATQKFPGARIHLPG